MSRYFAVPFALGGDTMLIPDTAPIDGSVSYQLGFGVDYEKQPGTPGYKFVPRAGHNVLFRDLTAGVGEVQRHGYSEWSADVGTLSGGYDAKSIVWHNGDTWQSQISGNTSEPTLINLTWSPSAKYMGGQNLTSSDVIFYMGQL